MLDGIRQDLERQIAHLLEEAERPMRVEEILPHLDPIIPGPNDVAVVLHGLAETGAIEQEGSFFRKSTPLPLDALFPDRAQRELAQKVVDLIRELDVEGTEGARSPLVLKLAKERGLSGDRVLDVVAILRNAGEAYSVGGDRLRLAKP